MEANPQKPSPSATLEDIIYQISDIGSTIVALRILSRPLFNGMETADSILDYAQECTTIARASGLIDTSTILAETKPCETAVSCGMPIIESDVFTRESVHVVDTKHNIEYDETVEGDVRWKSSVHQSWAVMALYNSGRISFEQLTNHMKRKTLPTISSGFLETSADVDNYPLFRRVMTVATQRLNDDIKNLGTGGKYEKVEVDIILIRGLINSNVQIRTKPKKT